MRWQEQVARLRPDPTIEREPRHVPLLGERGYIEPRNVRRVARAEELAQRSSNTSTLGNTATILDILSDQSRRETSRPHSPVWQDGS
jgi:hypothetical protein